MPSRRLPLLLAAASYFGSWTFLSVAGALTIVAEPGELWTFLGSHSPSAAQAIGTPVYFWILALPYLLVPPAMYCGWIAAGRFRIPQCGETGPWPLFAMTAASIGYCLFKLGATGNLVPDIFLHAMDYAQNIAERVRLISELHFLFYAVVYSILPMVSCLFLARWFKHHSALDLLGFAINFLFFYYVVVLICMKVPFMIFFGMVSLTVLLNRARLIYLPVTAILAAMTFLSMQVAMGGAAPEQKQEAAKPATVQAVAVAPAPSPAPVPSSVQKPQSHVQTPKPPKPPEPQLAFVAKYSFLRAPQMVTFRMGSAVPFYVSAYERGTVCGIETNRIPLLPQPACNIPARIFRSMYPTITNVVGFSPAAAHVSALIESGIGWSIVVLLIGGATLGVLSRIAVVLSGLASIGVSLATCAFAYYLTQVPLLGAFTYSHGLLFMLVPAMVVWASGLLRWPLRQSIVSGDCSPPHGKTVI